MAGGAGVGAGLGIMGGTLGGIGDIMSATKYKRPSLPEPGGQEKRLRGLTNAQLIGGGRELLAGQNLYNQMVPMLLGQLPGITITPTGGGGESADGGGGGAGGGSYAMADYSTALANYQNAMGRQQKLTALQAQMKAAKGADKKALRKQVKALKKEKKGSPTVPQLERQLYEAGSNPPPITVAPSTGETGPLGGFGTGGSPSLKSSLAEIMGFLKGSEGADEIPDFAGRYKTGFEEATPSSQF